MALAAMGQAEAQGADNSLLPPSGLTALWIIDPGQLTPAEQVLAQCVQGRIAGRREAIWLRGKSMYAVVEEQLRREGVAIHEVTSPWDLVKQFRDHIKGAIAYRLGTPSLNVATSLCGPMSAIALDETLLSTPESAGIKMLVDTRDMTEPEAFDKYKSLFAHGIAVEQSVDKPGNLRDFAVARKAFTYYTTDSDFRTKVAKEFGPQATVYGWGNDEYQWVSDISRANATGGPADWCLNLSVLQSLPAGHLRRPARPAVKQEDQVRYVAFVLTDGDNIQWLCGGFVDNILFWDSPLRGQFPMTWEVSPLLSKVAPRVLQHLYATAKPTDGFVTGAGAPGYTYPYFQPNRQALAHTAQPLLQAADLPVVSVLNANEGSLNDAIPLLDLPNVEGILYKDYAPYNRSGGKLTWRKGKPCLSYRYILWEKLMGPEELAHSIANMPTAPRTDYASYAIVNVHAWSFSKDGGPLEAVRQAIALLPADTRVITADQMIPLMSASYADH